MNLTSIYFFKKGETYMLLTVEVADRVDLFNLKGKDKENFGKLKFRTAYFKNELWFLASDIFNYLEITQDKAFEIFDDNSFIKYKHILIFTKENRLQDVLVININAIYVLDDALCTEKTENLLDCIRNSFSALEDKYSSKILYNIPSVDYVK